MAILGYFFTALIALVIGFVAGKLYVERSSDVNALQQQADESQQQMDQFRQDVTSNLALTQQMMAEMKHNYDNVLKQVELTSQLVEQQKITDTDVQYFGSAEANKFLNANNDNDDSTSQKQPEFLTQPPDYSTESSGLFNNTNEQKQIDTSES